MAGSTSDRLDDGLGEPIGRFSRDDHSISTSAARPRSPSTAGGIRAKLGLEHLARRTLGICLLLVTVFLWTVSNFITSFIFSDNSYDKPFFLVYVNTSAFAFAILPRFTRYMLRNGVRGLRSDVIQMWDEYQAEKTHRPSINNDGGDPSLAERLLVEDGVGLNPTTRHDDKFTFLETALLSLQFCFQWFLANYFASACLEYTSVASVTILSSTSSVWTFIACAVMGIESFSVRKMIGVLTSFAGVVLISSVDLSGGNDGDTGSFPHKTTTQIAIGDAMALLSAIVYGVYVTILKKRIGNEDRLDMQLFFGLVGFFNLVLLWPLFFVFHWTKIEPFEMPSTGHVWVIIIINAVASFVGDMSWAWAMLMTTPLVVSVGLSLMIPFSLVGEMIEYAKYPSFVYWVGAGVVFASFVFISLESREDGIDAKENNRPRTRESAGV